MDAEISSDKLRKPRAWTAVCASISIIAAGALAAYLANTTPRQTLIDALMSRPSSSELIGAQQAPSAPLFDNLAG
ncbi:MAG: hypothetical protein ACREP6_14315 [Candidatus Binataceae bacterium]